MASKENLLLLGLFVMVVLISSEVKARDLAKASSISTIARIVNEQKDASDVEYEKNACTEDHDHPDCFGIPWFGMPGGGDMPGGQGRSSPLHTFHSGSVPAGGGDKPGGGDMSGMPGGGDKPGGGDMPGMPGGDDKPGAPASGGPSV